MNKLIAIFSLAFLARLIHLDQSLWLDEATTAVTVRTLGVFDIVQQFSPGDFHPPLYYLLMDFWTQIFGYSEIALRAPSIFFSMGTGVIIYFLIVHSTPSADIKNLSTKRMAFFASAFFLFNPLVIYYSQEVRMYSMATFFMALGMYFLLKRNRSDRESICVAVSFALSFYTFYASIFFIITAYGYLILKRTYRTFFFSGGIFFLLILPLIPLLSLQWQGSRIALQNVSNWAFVLGKVDLKNLLLIFIKLTSGRISFEPKILYYFLASSWFIFLSSIIVFPLVKNKREHSMRNVHPLVLPSLYFMITPLVLGIMFSFFSPLLQYFRFQYVIVPLSVLFGVSIVRFPKAVGWVVFAGFALWAFAYLLVPSFHREDWKSLAGEIQKTKTPVYMIPTSSDPLRYYLSGLEIQSLKNTPLLLQESSVLIIPYTADIHGVRYEEELSAQRFVRTETHHVRGIPYELWMKK